MKRKLHVALLHPHCPEPRRLLLALLPVLLLAGCQDRELPTALTPEGAAFDHQANHCVVSSEADDGGATTLRTMIATPACATITFDVSVESIGLTSGPLTIERDLTITGRSEANRFSTSGVTVSGLLASRVFAITAGTTVTLSGLTIVRGSADNGGGILNDGTLTLTNSTIFLNNAGTSGAGIYNSGTLTLTHSTVLGNEADSGAGIYNSGTLTLTNSTVTENSAANSGGGIANFASMLTLTHSTVTANSAANGGGIANLWFGTARLRNTIIANSHSGGNCYGPITDLGHNLDSGTSCGFSTEDHSLSSTNPLLDNNLQHNGGPTPMYALQVGSPAIDAIPFGTNGCGTSITTDQRGVTRPQRGACDIGAFEVAPQPQAITFTSTPPTVALVGGSYAVSATVSSDLAVSFSSLTPAVCAVSGSTVSLDYETGSTVTGSTVSLDAAGTCIVAAGQAGNTHWLPAPQVTQNFTVHQPVTIDASGRLDGRRGAATLSGTLTCSAPTSIPLNVSLTQAQVRGKNTITVIGSGSTTVACSGTTPWAVLVTPASGRFAAGAASATASVAGTNPPVQASQTVQLR